MLPPVRTQEEWDVVVGDEAILRPGVEHLAARLGLAGRSLRRYPEGSVPVYAVGDRHVLKLYPALSADDGRTEAHVLRHLRGKLPVATPEVHADGEYENGWRYVLMTQLPGQGLAGIWPRAPGADRDRLASEVGAALAALHALDAGPLRGVLGPHSWSAFLAGQRATTVARQRERKLPELWAEQIPDFLDSIPLAGEPERVLLHTEFMREHLLVDPGRWTLSGLFDFEPAMLGDRAYEFVAVGLFVSRGDPRLLGRIAAAYGRTFPPRELMAYTLLHVYSNLPWYLRELPAPPEETLDSLAESWFGTV
ncbi:aminoglycoside phosphotransferase family protein [Streptomyces sp. H39-S7]|uniref:aminoglycoside phosphotransferase family protein n=1 Tax=Streptomyces sp. H39-S7 TaxID=3004357 RepID=UPI0022AF5808|nr:aminoglycoside 3'-phosphotransferase/choline kinase family protein [Streptomyces sp. H39-S7]MCZ4121879.1 aminoglycoside 3'-phosphotransferase/choline kinase family protein [Streptomyces sp. H39-S7]